MLSHRREFLDFDIMRKVKVYLQVIGYQKKESEMINKTTSENGEVKVIKDRGNQPKKLRTC